MNPLYIPWAGVAPGWAVIETVGRRSGKTRLTPVGGRLSGDTYWLMAIDGRQAQYVRNIESHPEVRVRVHGRWRAGKAVLVSDDDPKRRLWRLNPVNSLFLWTYGGLDPITMRIDFQYAPPVALRSPGWAMSLELQTYVRLELVSAQQPTILKVPSTHGR
jgi:deazaflavin-dependent oxidoreductase (nitroreductase family)